MTGIVLATEMTSSTTLLAPMLGACALSDADRQCVQVHADLTQLTRRAVSAFRVNTIEASSGKPVPVGGATSK